MSRENRKTGIGEMAGRQRMSEPTPKEDGNQVPDHFFVAPYGSEGCQEERVSSTPRGHRERTQLREEDWHPAKRQAEQLIREATASDAIKEAWMKLMYAEECLARGVKAFLPRI